MLRHYVEEFDDDICAELVVGFELEEDVESVDEIDSEEVAAVVEVVESLVATEETEPEDPTKDGIEASTFTLEVCLFR